MFRFNPSHQRYFGNRRPFWYNPLAGAWRDRVHDELTQQNASCFWHAACAVANSEASMREAIRVAKYESAAGLLPGLTYEEAIQVCITSAIHISVIEMGLGHDDTMWVIARRWVHPEQQIAGHCVVLAVHDDAGTYKPHWCPATAYHRRLPLPVTAADRLEFQRAIEAEELGVEIEDLAELARDMEEPNALHQLPDDQLLIWMGDLVDAVNFPEPPEHALAIYWRDVAGELAFGVEEPEDDADQNLELPRILRRERGQVPDWWRANANVAPRAHHPLEGIYSIVGVHPPPVPKAGLHWANCRTFYQLDHAGPLQWAQHMHVVLGAPSATARAAARLTGAGGIAWELCPENVQHMHVSSRHKVYVRLGAEHSLHPQLLEFGDYNPDRVGAIHTAQGSFSLSQPEHLVREDGAEFRVFSLTRESATRVGALARALPLHLEQVVTISFRKVGRLSFKIPRASFPDEAAWLTAQFSLLAEFCPRELLGILQDQRNRALAALEQKRLPAGFDPVQLVATLHEQRELARRRLAPIVGLARYCYPDL